MFKKIYVVDLDEVDGTGFLVRHEVADLLNISDPHNLGGFGPTFRFPFQTIESVIPLDRRRLGVLDDNNYPFSAGRVAGETDPNEFIIIRLDRPLVTGEGDDDKGEGEPYTPRAAGRQQACAAPLSKRRACEWV